MSIVSLSAEVLQAGRRKALTQGILLSSSGKKFLDSVPVMKLPAAKLSISLRGLTLARHELRAEVVDWILVNVYPGFSEKRAFRALVAPTLTRLHFARSEPPYFRLAPNARVWKTLDPQTRELYLAVTLFDFASVRLKLPPNMLPPTGSLRDTAKPFGPVAIDRVRGLDSMLRFYAPFLASSTDSRELVRGKAADFAVWESFIEPALDSSLEPSRILAIDEARYLLMKHMLEKKVLLSSFVADEWLKGFIRNGKLNALRTAYAAIESVIMSGHAINAVMRSEKQ